MKVLNNNMKYVIATIKSWNIEESKRFISMNPDLKVHLLTNKEELTYQKIKKFNPRYIFFPHWSCKIPAQIYRNYECVVFHMTDLPFGRGGSPLQNLIERGIYKTKISAIKVVDGIDSGPIYLKRELNLNGSATAIFKRASKIIFKEMIPYILKNKPKPIPQKCKIVIFKRRKPEQSNICNLKDLQKAYDYIRMLDAEGYPNAFIKTENLKFEFFNARIKKDRVLAKVHIFLNRK